MFIQVKLLHGFQEPLWYTVPDDWQSTHLRGAIVQVPLRKQLIPAFVIDEQADKPNVPFALRAAHSLETFPRDPLYQTFITQLAAYYQIEPVHFVKRIRHFVAQKEVKPFATQHKTTDVPKVTLTDEQQTACDFVLPRISSPEYTPVVLHGVTGSGKTEVYKKSILHALAHNKSVILLLPEVTLAINFEKRLKQELPDHVPIYGFHSGTTAKEKKVLWQQLLEEKPLLIIGVHLPTLMPIANLGLIIVDEEHEVGYQEKKHPKIHSKEAAIWRAQLNKIPIILGSATPTLNTLHCVKTKGWHLFELKNRFAGAFPKIKQTLLTNKRQRKQFWISQELQESIKDRLNKKEQTILFLNRRGFSFFVQCSACSFIFECNNCSVSLTLHDHNALVCHYCGINQKLPLGCPGCKVGAHEFLKKGIGTQQIVQIVQTLFPDARIARADMDTTTKKKLWQKTMQDFTSGELDILIGTQTITKGYHFPNVTLVGILWADLNLNFPVFNATETTLQQLIQVAGRAGRQHMDSLVIVQSMADHPLFAYLNETDYIQFYEREASSRKLLGYPPFKRLVEIELKHSDESIVEQDAQLFAHYLRTAHKQQKSDLHILGPSKPPVHKVKRTHAQKLYIKSATMSAIIRAYQQAMRQKKLRSSIYFTPNPVS